VPLRFIGRKEERKWARFANSAIYRFFIRTKDGNGKDSLEFATAINISPGGALVVCSAVLCQDRRRFPFGDSEARPIGPVDGLKDFFPDHAGEGRLGRAPLMINHLLGLKFRPPP